MSKKKIKVLLEMRPAMDGFAGIPQETRLLYRGLKKIENIDAYGMLQTSHKILARGLPPKESKFKLSRDKQLNLFSKVIISVTETPYKTFLEEFLFLFKKKIYLWSHLIQTVAFRRRVKLTKFVSEGFEDFIWRTLFSKTLPASDFSLVASSDFYINSVPWGMMHKVGLSTLGVLGRAMYNRLDVSMADIFIGQTPYPAHIVGGAKVVIRYHDAIPIFMPHTISDKSFHQKTHYYALRRNVLDGAWFACVSETTRYDLLKLFPQAEGRSVVIYNIISHHYFREDNPRRSLVPGIIRSRLYSNDPDLKDFSLFPKFLTLREQEIFYRRALSEDSLRYLLIVSTIEPRKNHVRLLAAWEIVKAEIDPSLKLVVVGTLGWDYKQLVKGFKTWIDRGELFMLNSVPAPDLRLLYRNAEATVCPSLGEGFDYSGVESMASGGITIASDIPVHREVYDDAAEYFDPYSTISLVNALKKVIYDVDSTRIRERLLVRGAEVASRYRPEKILPQWEEFLLRVARDK